MSPEAHPDLEHALRECLEALERDGSAALETACAARPDLAPLLRRRVALLASAALIDLAPGAAELPERLGDFEPGERLGAGAMGVVHRARQVSTGREVALKLVRPEQLAFPGARERFRREVDLTARLFHPSVLPVLAVGEERGLPWFALELVRGASLAAVLAALRTRFRTADAIDARALPELVRSATPEPLRAGAAFAPPRSWRRFALGVARDVAAALAHAHGNGVLHRDVKPSNVLLALDGRVFLTDFGLASAPGAASLTAAGSAVGSLPYMAPEVLGGAPADARSDVYGAGALLYELLTLHRPFEAESPAALVSAILAGRPTPPRRHAPRLSADAQAVLLRALEPDPARRYATAHALVEDLDNLLALRPTRARPAGAVARLAALVRRRPAASAAVALAALLVVGTPSAVAWTQARGRRAVLAANERLAGALAVAESERARADQNLERAARAAQVLLAETGEKLLDEVPLMQGLERLLLARARDVLEELVPADTSEPRYVLLAGEVERALADVEREAGDEAAARELLERALARLDARPDCEATDGPRTRALRVQLLRDLGHVEETRDPARARALQEAAVAVPLQDGDVAAREERLLARTSLHDVLVQTGEPAAAREQLDLGLADLERLEGITDARRHASLRARALGQRGMLSYLENDDAGAVRDLAAAVDALDALAAEDPEATRALADATSLRISLVAALLRAGEIERAEAVIERARADGERLIAWFPRAPSFRVKQAGLLINLGLVRDARGDVEGSGEAWREAAAQGRALAAEPDPTPETLLQAGLALGNLTSFERDQGRLEECIALSHEAEAALRRALALSPGDLLRSRMLEFALLNRAHASLELGRVADGAAALEQAAAVAPAEKLAQRALVDAELALAAASPEADRPALHARALATLERALALGWHVPGELEGNPDFAPLRALPDWPPGSE